MKRRLRRNRKSPDIRNGVSETTLLSQHLVYPLFITDDNKRSEIETMPGIYRYPLNEIDSVCHECVILGLMGIALFPAISDDLKTSDAREGLNPSNLVCKAIKQIKASFPNLTIITDIALDPYSSDGHDGLVKQGTVINDETCDILGKMAVLHAEAGADIVAPSDMMDGRVSIIRTALDCAGHTETSILSYAVKYASALYGPFRDALNSAPKSGDKKTYQMDPANRREALEEARLDYEEGADFLMVKPGSFYQDIIRDLSNTYNIPIAAYQVSGEYSMIRHASGQGALDFNAVMYESLLSLRRSGANIIFTYAALDMARFLMSKYDSNFTKK